MKRNFILLLALVVISLLQGCSGSGGSNGGGSFLNITPTSTGTVTLAKLALQFNEATTVTASFLKSSGLPASGVSVNFTTTLGTMIPSNGVAITDANGVATVQLVAGTSSGQGQVTASATVDNTLISKTGLFSVTLPQLSLSNLSLGLSTLSYGGSTSVSVTVLDSNGAVFTSSDVDVVFTSTQMSLGNATINSPVKTVNGVATTTYTANTFSGTDTITATVSGATSSVTILVNSLAASSISFVSATPKNIGLKGMGGAGITETSTVLFKVFNTAGQPAANQQVDFTLNTAIGGLSLSQSSGSTATDGTVSTIVQAGTIATPVRVTATLRGTNPPIATQSDLLVVSTGVPSQDGFSISVSTLNPEALSIDGVTDIVTARLSDHFHNPVPDGTAVTFTTSGGSIQPSCTTIGGSCSVTWASQSPRPANGRARVLAYAVGEEAFLDTNGNGLADAGEFIDTTEAFRDDNENGVRDAGETFIDFNSDGIFNPADGLYNGVLQGAAYTGAPKSKHVFSNTTIVMASSSALISNSCGNSVVVGLGGSTSCNITVNDINGNTMPAGTTVSFSFTNIIAGITLISDTYTFPNTAANSGVTLGVTLVDDGTAPVGRGALKVLVTSPGGLQTVRNYSVN